MEMNPDNSTLDAVTYVGLDGLKTRTKGSGKSAVLEILR